ncbi:MAG: protein kinase, partial [Candidatus Eisenbacteria bacterium]
EHLDRDVAIKVLPEGALGDEAARRRFQREARAASRVNHPNVGVIYDFGSDRGTDFLAMEFVRGEGLDRVASRGPLAERDLIAIGLALADALAALHELGVIHCDLKPANVIRTPDGTVKLVDFGLSRLLRRADERPTRSQPGEGGWAGTLPYMAPEQFTGARLDARTDLYALGVLLYELATGRPPHTAADAGALMYAIVHTPAPALPPGATVSGGFATTLRRLLEKIPERRPASAADLCATLRGLLGGPVTTPAPVDEHPRVRALAVLPLANLSADPQQEFFADGMTEALIADLTAIEALRLISRTSVMRFKGTTLSLPEIARELGVEAVVEGSVLRAGGHVRITVQLVDAAADRNMWARSYERPLDDVLALQREVARAIAAEIRVHVTPREAARLESRPEVPAEAVDAYLRGRYLWNRRTETDVRRALEFFRRAVGQAPGYARAHAGIADAFAILGDLDALSPSEARAGATAAAERALALDPGLPEAHTSLGFIRDFFEWDWSAAEAAYRRAIEAGPSYATARQWYAELLVGLGRFDEAIAESQRAVALDPLSMIMQVSLADVLYFARDFPRALRTLRGVLELDPGFATALTDLGRMLTETGAHDEAIESFRHAERVLGTGGKPSAGLAYALARAGRVDEARHALAEMEARLAPAPAAAGRHSIAVTYLALGDRERAIEWLERAHRDGDRALVWLKVHPRLDPLRGDARFERLIDAMNLR